MAMYRKPLVPDDFKVPQELVLETCILLPLTIDHTELDHEAVMDKYDEEGDPINTHLTLKQNTIDLGYHQKEHQKRAAFTFTILTPDQSECMGCLYMYPCNDEKYDVEVDYWLRDKYSDSERDILEEIKKWLESEWPFDKIFYVC